MTENEMLKIAVHCLGVQAEQEVCEECDIYGNCHTDCKDVAVVAIKALKEVQQYREIGTVEQVKNQKENLNVAYQIISDYEQYGTVEEFKMTQRYMRLVNAHGTIGQVIDSCAEYEEIGTVEECREAVEKLLKAEKALNTILSGNYNDECSFCVHSENPMANCQRINLDGSWCIHNAKWNGKVSDDENLEGMEDEKD